MTHVGRRQELTLLEVDDTSRFGRRHNQIRLPGEERGDLQHVDDRRRGRRLRRFVDVGQDRDPHALFDPGEHPEPFLQAWPTKGPERCAIRLVERRLKNERHPAAPGDLPDRVGELECVPLALDDTRSPNQDERPATANDDVADGYLRHEDIIRASASSPRAPISAGERFGLGRPAPLGKLVLVARLDELAEQRVRA